MNRACARIAKDPLARVITAYCTMKNCKLKCVEEQEHNQLQRGDQLHEERPHSGVQRGDQLHEERAHVGVRHNERLDEEGERA